MKSLGNLISEQFNVSGSLSVVPKDKTAEVSLNILECEIFTISPIKVS